MQVARSSDKREIVWGWEPGVRVGGEHRRLRPTGTPPPVVGLGVRFVRSFLPEQLLTSFGMSVARSELIDFLVLCNSSGIVFIML